MRPLSWLAPLLCGLLACHTPLQGRGGDGSPPNKHDRKLIRSADGLPEQPRERARALLERAELQADEGRWGEALASWAWAWEEGDEDARGVAQARAWVGARQAPEAELRGLVEGDGGDFVRAYAGAALLWRVAAQEGGREELAQLWLEVEPALRELGDEALLQELGARRSQAAGGRPARVGLLLPLTGKDRRVGERALAGALVAEGVFEPGREAVATLLIEDTGSTVEGASAGVRALYDQGASVIIGPLDAQEARSAGREASALGLPLIALSADEGVVEEGEAVYRLSWDRDAEVEALLDEAAGAGVRRLVVLFPDAPVGRKLAAAARAAGQRRNIEVIELGPYDPAAKDYSALARQARQANPGAIFIPDAAERVARILPFLAAEGVWCSPGAGREEAALCLGNSTWNEPRLLRDGGAYVEGARLAVGYTTLAPGALNQRFVLGWRASVGVEPPDLFGAYAFDAVLLGRSLAQLGGPQEAREALSRLPQAEGAGGALEITPSRHLRRPPTLLEVKGGALVLSGAQGR